MFVSIPRLSQVKEEHLYIYINKSIKYKLRKELNIFQKKMIESTLSMILNKKLKILIIGCVYKHPKHEVKYFTNNHMMPPLDKLQLDSNPQPLSS